MSEEPLLCVRDLHVSFPSEAGRVDAVRGISFDLHAGQTIGIVGESGSGKSVTSLAVMGLLPGTAKVTGSVKLQGRELLDLSDKSMSAIRGNQIAMIFQDPLSSLTPVFSIGRQLVEALQIHQKLSGKQAVKRAEDLLKLVGIPDPAARMRNFPHEFSGGMRQRVMIAMAMANDPSVIIADEPTTALDVTIQAQILEVLEKAQEETGAAVVMITHDLGVVAGNADEVVVMYAGKPVEQAPVHAIFYQPRMPYTIGLLAAIPRIDETSRQRLVAIEGNPPLVIDLPPGCPFEPRCPIAIEVCREREPELVARSGGSPKSGPGMSPETGPDNSGVASVVGPGVAHRIACHRADEIDDGLIEGRPVFPVPPPLPDELAELPREQRAVALSATNLVKTFPLLKGALVKRRIGTVRAVNGVTFDIREGETMAIVGESGCGKTTTLLEIMNLQPEAGTLEIGGTDVAQVHGGSAVRRLRRDLQIVFQDPMGALDPRLTVFDVISEPLRAVGADKAGIESRVDELMDLVGLDPTHADRFPGAFSGGQRQRIAIARALSTKPKLIVLDEPVSALDVSIQAGVINLLEDLKAQLGLSYLFVAHDLAVVRHIADRIAVMYLGDFVEYGDADRVFSDPQHPYTRALLSAIPVPDPDAERSRDRVILLGDLPSPTDEISGCSFRSRCPLYLTLEPAQQQRCRESVPLLHGQEGVHTNACHFR